MLKKLIIMMFVFIFALSSTGNLYVAKASELSKTNIILTADKNEYKIGDTVNVTVESQNTMNLFAVQFALSYDASALQLQDDGITPLEGFNTQIVQPSGQDGTTTYAFTQSSLGTTSKKVVNLSFKAKKKGTFKVQLTNIKAVDERTSYINNNTSAEISLPISDVPMSRIEMQNSAVLSVGENLTLNAVVYPENTTDKGLIWSSSNESVASVNQNGKVTAIASGQANIIVKSASNENVSAKCTIYVKNNNANLSSISINGTPLSNFKSSTTTYDVVLPEGTSSAVVTAVPSDKNASLIITQVKTLPGIAAIVVTAEDGKSTVTYKLNISVIKVTGIKLSKNNLTLTVGGKAALTAKVSPSEASQSAVNWSSSNSDVAAVDQSGNITAKAAGVAEIKVSTKDGAFSDSCTVIVQVDKNKLSDEINNASAEGKKEIVVSEENTSEGYVPLPLDQVQTAQDKNLNFKVDFGSQELTVPSDVVDISKYVKDPEKSSLVLAMVPSNSTGENEANFKVAGNVFEINMSVIDENDNATQIHNFDNNSKVKVSIQLTADQLKNIKTKDLSAFYFNESTKEWENIPGGSFDSKTSTFTFETSHFTKFAVMEAKVENTKVIPKTGSPLDFTTSNLIGFMVLALGVGLVGLRKRKQD